MDVPIVVHKESVSGDGKLAMFDISGQLSFPTRFSVDDSCCSLDFSIQPVICEFLIKSNHPTIRRPACLLQGGAVNNTELECCPKRRKAKENSLSKEHNFFTLNIFNQSSWCYLFQARWNYLRGVIWCRHIRKLSRASLVHIHRGGGPLRSVSKPGPASSGTRQPKKEKKKKRKPYWDLTIS